MHCSLHAPPPFPLTSLFALRSRLSLHLPKELEPPPPNQSRLHLTPKTCGNNNLLGVWGSKKGYSHYSIDCLMFRLLPHILSPFPLLISLVRGVLLRLSKRSHAYDAGKASNFTLPNRIEFRFEAGEISPRIEGNEGVRGESPMTLDLRGHSVRRVDCSKHHETLL